MLAGTASATTSRTRHGGKGRPDLAIKEKQFPDRERFDAAEEVLLLSSSDSSWVDSSTTDEDSPSEDEEAAPRRPPASRAILEVDALSEAMEKHCKCCHCGGPMTMSMKTTCLASSIVLTCSSRKCHYIYSQPPTPVMVESKDNRERSTNYAINILYVMGFLSVGDGCTESARLLGLLGLPNSTTMETRSFSIIEERIGKTIRKVSQEIMLDNLVLEVESSKSLSPNELMLWKAALTDDSIVLDKDKYPKIQVSYDMAWQQRNSGNRYNSASGHGLLVGGSTRKVVCMTVKSKICGVCSAWKRKMELLNNNNEDEDDIEFEVPPHECPKNHDGSSASMEALACLEMVTDLYDGYRVVIKDICIDDDASTRAILSWSNKDYLTNNNTTEVPLVPKSKGINKGKLQKRKDKGRLPGHIPEPGFLADPNHRRKHDAELYAVLHKMMERFCSLERLQEVAHGLDTQPNESFNNSASWFAPKNKVYCSSMSLANRLSMAIGITTLGLEDYFKRLYKELGILMTDDVCSLL
jgi:hypothetical protein